VVARVVVGEGVLTVIAEAPHPETLRRVQHVLGSTWRASVSGSSSP
jgi:hypothetical protein